MSNEKNIDQWWTVPGDAGGVLELRQVPMPTPKTGGVLIKVHAAGVNRGELISKPALRSDDPLARPRPSGIECAGEIAALGDAVYGWHIGDRVMTRGVRCHATYATADAASLMAIPEHLNYLEAAAIPNVFITAHDAMVSQAKVQAGEAILITAGSSGVGSAALQIAAYLGAGPIIATSRSPAKAERLRDIGASHVIDSRAPNWANEVLDASDGKGVNVVIDQVGGDIFPNLMAAMAISGRYISVGRNAGAMTALNLDELARKRLQLIGVTFRTRSAAQALACSSRFIADLLPAFADKRLRPVIDRSFPLRDLPQAHVYMDGNDQFGKILLDI